MSDTPALDAFRVKHRGRVPVVSTVIYCPYTIETRRKVRVPTPFSKRRCYNGCFHSSDWEMVWTGWEVLETNVTLDRLDFWKSISRTTTQYRIKKEKI